MLCVIAFFLMILYPLGADVFTDKKELYVKKFQDQNLDLLVLGSSRAEHTILPELLDTTKRIFNMGEDGYGMPSSYLMLKVLTNNYGIKIKSVLLEVDEYSFQGSTGFTRQFRDDDFYKFVDDDEVYDAFKKYRNAPLALILRAYPNIGDLLYNDFSKFLKNYPYAFKEHSVSLSKSFDKSVVESAVNKGYNTDIEPSEVKKPDRITHYKLEADDVAYFEKIVALCKEKKIRLILFRAPIMYCEAEDSHLLNNFLNKVCKASGISFYDYKCSYQYKQFYTDNKHITDTIARLVTRDIATKINLNYSN